jgi:hypothetical protein
MMGIFTIESLQGVAWILGGIWGVVRSAEIILDHLDSIRWKISDKHIEKNYALRNELEEIKKERDMMLAYFFPAKDEVATEAAAPAKKKRGRPRKYK